MFQKFFSTSRVILRKFDKMVRAKKFILATNFNGMPKPNDFKLEQENLPDLTDGEFLSEAIFWSVDPYMRKYSALKPAPYQMFGLQIAKVIDSKNQDFPVGTYISTNSGWRTHTVHNPVTDSTTDLGFPLYKVEEIPGHPLSIYLGAAGMPGNTAYFGFVPKCQPKAGETLVVTGAAGAVGNQVGQIAKILGLNVVGITGSPEKARWLKNIGFDDVVNYKTESWVEELRSKTPKGIDCFFDNIGGEISSQVILQMNKFGRVAVCGAISTFNSQGDLPKATVLQPAIVSQSLTISGLHATHHYHEWQVGIKQNVEWLKAGKLTYKETIHEGFDSLPKALISIMSGDSIGKTIVRATNEV